MDLLNRQENQPNQAQTQEQTNPIKIEVQTTDASGNVRNTWGTFNGEYDNWQTFRDQWLGAMHNNDKIKTIVKFQNLRTACIGPAKGALGEWDLTDENYGKAWERLQAIYEDDYMQCNAFMQKLGKIPRMQDASSKTIRDVINTVQKHIHGAARYVKLGNKHPYVVFTVIDRMDTETYRAWEKYRPTLAKAEAQAANADGSVRQGKHIPTWEQLEEFLEGEVTIRVHAEHRNKSDAKPSAKDTFKQKRSKQQGNQNRNTRGDSTPEWLQCVLCNTIHTLFRCDVFKDMNLNGRKNHVQQYNLCDRCLRKRHTGQCEVSRCNKECPRCPGKYHNSFLCSNKEIEVKTAMLTQENHAPGRKRRGQPNNKWQAKRHRSETDNKRQQNDRLQSTVNVVGDWTLMARESNAIKQMKGTNTEKKKGKPEYTVLLATINIRIQAFANLTVICRAIADTGASLNCITRQYVEENRIKAVKCQRPILGVTGPEILKRKIIAWVSPWFESNIRMRVEFYVLNELNGVYPYKQINASKEHIMHLGLADENFDTPAPIDALLGAEFYANIINTDIYKHKDGAIMHATSFGHIILGKFVIPREKINDLPILSIVQNENYENVNIEKALNRFWEIEEINKSDKLMLSEEEKAVEEIFVNTYYREKNGRYVVTIPIKPECKGLGDSRGLALRQFNQLERRFERNPELRQKNIESMREYQALGYMRLANRQYDPKFSYWLPHHAVMKKFRIVYNASAKTKTGESLNSIQLVGSKLQYDLQLQVMRFRRNKIGVATDISKMFNRIGLNPKQWDLHRVFWRESPNEPIKEYVLTVVTFGLASSAYNSVRALNQCAMDQAMKYPEAAKTIQKCFYMDDGIFGGHTINDPKMLCKEIEFVLEQGGFKLKGWASNSKEVEEYMNAKTEDVTVIGEIDEEKILGLCWIKSTDELGIFVRQMNMHGVITKRGILKEIAKLYDPNGFIAPIIVKAKMIMQKIWGLKEIKWDDEVTAELKNEWLELYANLPRLSELKIKRWINTGNKCQIQLHGFCDASEKAYGTAIYVRVVNENNENFSSLLSAKSRVAPLKEITIPRLELLAAVMLSEQMEAIIQACEFQDAKVTLWSDSTITINWIKKQPHELKAFVANRVKTIQEITKNWTWKHVQSADNPADLVSRGMKMQDFLCSKLWLEGPSWLKKANKEWPMTKLTISPEARMEIRKECKIRTEEMAVMNIFTGKENKALYHKFQEWSKIINITAYVLRMVKERTFLTNDRFILSEKRNKAIEFWIKYEQQKAYPKEIESIKAGDKIPKKSHIIQLLPIMDKNGILRIGGRIDKANIAYESRHQYIVPPRSRLSYLLLRFAHASTLHGGAQMMMQFTRKSFWIPRLRQEAKMFIRTCKECVVQANVTAKQIMSELPEIRIRPAPPFQHVGVDTAGPYNMRITDKINMNSRMRSLPDIKGWVAVFVCLVTRAVHLEPTEGMSSDDFLAAYQRFVSRRGNPERIYSDNGTNFVGANRELQQAFQTWEKEKIQHWVHTSGTQWKFITPSAPHEGGIWEAAVKSMKHHLKRVMGPQKYSIQGITTLLASIEACLNSRPLCALSEDPEDNEALTPAHFLIGRSLRLPMHEQANAPPGTANKLFKQMQFQIQSFWIKWSNDYLQALTQKPKWREEQENLKVGQLVLIKSDNIPPTYWAMGRIIETHEGKDGKVRQVMLKTQSGILERSIRKLCVLPGDVELKYWS